MSGADDTEAEVPTIDVSQEEEWKQEPKVTFGERASLEIARWVLLIFSGVYLLCFLMAFFMFFMEGADYQSSLELVRFLLGAILPLVTLAIGYYLGERSSSSDT